MFIIQSIPISWHIVQGEKDNWKPYMLCINMYMFWLTLTKHFLWERPGQGACVHTYVRWLYSHCVHHMHNWFNGNLEYFITSEWVHSQPCMYLSFTSSEQPKDTSIMQMCLNVCIQRLERVSGELKWMIICMHKNPWRKTAWHAEVRVVAARMGLNCLWNNCCTFQASSNSAFSKVFQANMCENGNSCPTKWSSL